MSTKKEVVDKIAYITMQFPVPSETFASNDIDALSKYGCVVDVYGLRAKHKDYKKLIAERKLKKLYIDNFNIKSIARFFFVVARYPHVFISLICWIFNTCRFEFKHLIKSFILLPSVLSIFFGLKKNNYDVVHLFWGHYPSMVGFLVKKYLPDMVLSTFLGAHDLIARYPGSLHVSKLADCCFTHSADNLNILKKYGFDSDRFVVVNRGTKIFIFTDNNKFKHLNNVRVLTASRLIKEKGVDDVLQVFSSLLEFYPEANLNIAGEGPCKEELQNQAIHLGVMDKVNFLGHVSQSELIVEMHQSHIFILMSKYEGERLPNVVKEAMLQKCFTITTDTVGIRELIPSDKYGLVVDQCDVSRVITEALNVLGQPCVMQNIAQQGAAYIKENFDVDKMMSKYLDEWNAVKK